MDSDFINNLTNMMKNGNIPDSVKEKMSRIYEPKFTVKILMVWIKQRMNLIVRLMKIGSSNSINPEMLQNLMKMFSNSSNNSSETEGNSNNSSGSNPSIDINTILKMKSIMDKMR